MKQIDKFSSTGNMTAPIADFVKEYANSNMSRLHMPGHKGKTFLGCELFDITEIHGADSLYEAESIIAESERNAAKLFGSARTVYSTEGSSQCIRAMLYLALLRKKGNKKRPVIAAARNVHKAFIYAATLLDFDVIWLWPEKQAESICSCFISAKTVENVLKEHRDSVVAVYVTSPDYLGGQDDIRAIADVCHKHDTILAVDNAHGAYLHFMKNRSHPLDLGADICCDSAHKTLPVLTGGAYLHISGSAPKIFKEQAKYAMGLFGSTSPSYLIMASLDLCNQYLAKDYQERLQKVIAIKEEVCKELTVHGWIVRESDPLKITVEIPKGVVSNVLTSQLRKNQIECEYVDPDFLVFMITPENTKEDFYKLVEAMGDNPVSYQKKESMVLTKAKQIITIREAMFSEPENISVNEACNRICRVPTVSCPPAIPIAVPGEIIDEQMIALFHYYGIETLDVIKEEI